MKLRFLGQIYYKPDYRVETIPSDLTACYRGQKYALRRPVQTFYNQSVQTVNTQLDVRTYRGVVYAKAKDSIEIVHS